jgi:glycosyltransferase involved in cell wall biosynthesis
MESNTQCVPAPTLSDEAIGGERPQNRETVLIIGPTPPPAHGISVLTELLLRSDLKQSFEVVHLDTADRRTLDNVGRFELGNVALALYHGARFLWLLLRHRPALVYVPVSESRLGFLRDCLFLVPCRVFGIPLVLHLHGGQLDTLYAQGGAVFRWLMRFCFNHAARGIVLSESFRTKFAGLVEDDRVRVVYNGIPLTIYEAWKNAGKNKNNSSGSANTRTVLFLGVLIESKGFFDLLRAVPLVLERTKDVRFVFVGDTSFPECARAKEWAHEHALDPYVSFLGTKSGDDKTRVFLESDIFAFPTWYPLEGQPVAMIEAMAAGLPVVTTRHATIPDILGEDGALYVNKQDPADIAGKLLQLLEDGSLRKSMGQKNQNKFLQWHTADKFAAGVGGVLREAICVPSHAVDCVEGL